MWLNAFGAVAFEVIIVGYSEMRMNIVSKYTYLLLLTGDGGFYSLYEHHPSDKREEVID